VCLKSFKNYMEVVYIPIQVKRQKLTEGRQGYLVRRTFIPNDKIEEKFMMDKDNKV
jgi:hypothetical protein